MENSGIRSKIKQNFPGPGSFLPETTLTKVAYTICGRAKNKGNIII
jgi:hypothetical protein